MRNQLTREEVRDLEIFVRGLPARARDDERAIRVLAELYADLYGLASAHVIRRIAAQVEIIEKCQKRAQQAKPLPRKPS